VFSLAPGFFGAPADRGARSFPMASGDDLDGGAMQLDEALDQRQDSPAPDCPGLGRAGSNFAKTRPWSSDGMATTLSATTRVTSPFRGRRTGGWSRLRPCNLMASR